MKFYSLLFLLFSMASCKDDIKITKHKVGVFLVEGHFLNDTTMDGKMNYYDRTGKLVSVINYQKGVQHGASVNYYYNGIIYDSVSFNYGFKEGFHYIYDSTGKLDYVDFYLKGHRLGPQVYYSNGKVSQYYFNNFETEPIYTCIYDSSAKMIKDSGQINIAIPSVLEINNKLTFGLFAYFLNPPRISIKYSLFSKDSILKKDNSVMSFENSKIFLDTIFNLPIDRRFTYYYKADYFDSSNKKRKIYITKLDFD